MAGKDAKIIQWKHLWQLTSGIYFETPNETVLSELRGVATDLRQGIKVNSDGKSATGSSSTGAAANKPSKMVEQFKKQFEDKLNSFIDKLKQHLDLTQTEAWELFCCYLLTEYHSSTQALLSHLASETNTANLLKDLWNYYSLERMTQLKVLKNMLEFGVPSSQHPYAEEYRTVLNEIGLDKLRTSYIDQLARLVAVRETPPTISDFTHSYVRLVAWTERKLRETCEVLQILLLIIDRDHVKAHEFKTLLNLFKSHSFGRQQQYLDTQANSLHLDLVQKVTYSEVAIFIKCINVNCFPETNSQWINEVIQLLEDEVKVMHHSPEHGPILLAWMLLNYRIIDLYEEDEQYLKYRKYGAKAVHLGVFGYLHTLICQPMFKDESVVAKLVRGSIYEQLSQLCILFDDGAVAQHPHIFELFSELLTTPDIARDFCETKECGTHSLYSTVLEGFPFEHFEHLSLIAHALAHHRLGSKFIRNQLENLVIYTEPFNDDRTRLRQSSHNDEHYILTHNFAPFGDKIDYIIEAGTIANLRDTKRFTTIHFHTKLNYFNALHHEINELMRSHEIDQERRVRVTHGLKYLAIAVRRTKTASEISAEMVHPIELVFDILIRFKAIPEPPIDLLAQCLEVCAALVPLFPQDICRRVINLDILPFVSNQCLDYEEYSNGGCFDSGTVGYYLVTFEKSLGRYDFLTAFLKLLKAVAKSKFDQATAIELPGLIFLLREVIPYIHSWRFESESDRQSITLSVLQYFVDVLSVNASSMGTQSILRNTCAYSLLHLETGMTILRFVTLGNAAIEERMLNESNWMSSSASSYNTLIEKSMTILTRILKQRYTDEEKPTSRTPLEAVVYSQPKYVIPVITSYMNNIFDRGLPVLSCSLLQLFALEFQMPMLACLDMEPAQIRSTFLDRLENELERVDLKMAVIEFVEACINKQLGLTEAFFKTNYADREEKSKTDPTEGIVAYMELYLNAVKTKPAATIENPLLRRIMSLFHSLWKNNMQTLVEKLTDDKSFWTTIMNPLFADINIKSTVYSQCFNMLGLELYRIASPNDVPESLRETFKRFLTKPIFKNWVDEILKPEAPNGLTTSQWLSRMQSFKDLFVIILRRKARHGIAVPDDGLIYFANKCLARLIDLATENDDLRPFIILSELYLTILLTFTHKFTNSPVEDRTFLLQVTTLLNCLSATYDDIHSRVKDSILAIALKTTDLFAAELADGADVTANFMQSIIGIVASEVTATENHLRSENNKAAGADAAATNQTGEYKNLSFILCFNVFKAYLNSFNNHTNTANFENFITSNSIFNRILSCLNVSLPIYRARRMSYEMLDMLVTLAAGPFSANLLHCDIGYYLWVKLLPPRELVQDSCPVTPTAATAPAKPVKFNSTATWQPQDWWPIYGKGIQLVTQLLQQHQHLFVKEAIMCVGVHEQFLMDSILLAKHSLQEDALQLIKNAMELVCELIPFEKIWRLEHIQSMFNLMRCVQILLDHAVSLLSRPKILQRLTKDVNTTLSLPPSPDKLTLSDDEIKAYNKLIEIITIAIKCLLVFSPKLLNLLNDAEFTPGQWQPLVEIEFTAPKLNIGPHYSQLTFGTLLRAASFFAKTLQVQQHTFHEIPLNRWVESQPGDEVDKSSYISSIHQSIVRGGRNQTYSSSLSVSSTSGPSLEVHAHVDANLCVTALEFVLTLLGSQSLLALKDTNLSQREKQLIKREISSELHDFHDYVRKRVLASIEIRDPLHRKKHGVSVFRVSFDGRPVGAQRSTRLSLGGAAKASSMRVQVTRRMHLTTHQTGTPSPTISSAQPKSLRFDMTHDISGFDNSPRTSAGDLPSSTPAGPFLPKSCLKRGNVEELFVDAKRAFEEEEEPIFFDPEEPSQFAEWKYVNLVEEDYLHFLANLFAYICQTE